MKKYWYHSLRARLLLPVLVVASLTAVLLAVLSFFLGRQWAIRDVDSRFTKIDRVLTQSSFPLTSSVVASLAELTDAELLAVTESYGVVETSMPEAAVSPSALREAARVLDADQGQGQTISLGDKSFLVFMCQGIRRAPGSPIRHVLVLFDRDAVDAASRRAGLLPLLTGISTIALLASLTILLADRLALRMTRLQQRVSRVAEGDFDTILNDGSPDELGQLSRAVDSMTVQLKGLWGEVNRQQSEKLLYQLAGGMAHQLRNTLTGARMAMELHARRTETSDHEELRVGLGQLEIAEQYVRRLLLVGQGQQEKPQPQAALECLEQIQQSMSSVATHWNKQTRWDIDSNLQHQWVPDGPSFSAAVSNLVLNAIQAGENVTLQAGLTTEALVQPSTATNGVQLRVSVLDDGPGIASEISDRIFDPFVTTKPEGIGLGLPVVRRAAEQLGGCVNWSHHQGQTVFVFQCNVQELDA